MHEEVEMKALEYLLPETVEEALEYLKKGVPLAGGTALTPQRKDVGAVVDLRKLNLDRMQVEDGWVEIGATIKLQAMVETELNIPEILKEVCKLEAGWNLRNMATLGGTIMSADGRSPMLTTLLALDAQVVQEPDSVIQPLEKLLLTRQDVQLITQIKFQVPSMLFYDQVARAPADFPLINAAVASWKHEEEERVSVALGGYGAHPIKLDVIAEVLNQEGNVQSAMEVARAAFRNAGDAWASAAYRSDVAGTMVKRLLEEVFS
jgi:probable selenate reductase FAD-binding subunit